MPESWGQWGRKGPAGGQKAVSSGERGRRGTSSYTVRWGSGATPQVLICVGWAWVADPPLPVR